MRTKKEEIERADRINAEQAKAKQDKADALSNRLAIQNKSPQTYSVGGLKVTKGEYDKAKAAFGTATEKEEDKDIIAMKQEATRLGLKEQGEMLTPQILENLQRRKADSTQQEATLKQKFPDLNRVAPDINPNGIVEDINTEGGRAQVRDELERRAGVGIYAEDVQSFPEERIKLLAANAKAAAAEVMDIIPFAKYVMATNEEQFNNLKSSLDKRKETFSKFSQQVEDTTLTPEVALELIENEKQRLNEAESEIKSLAILSPSIRRSRDLEDVEVTMVQQRESLFAAEQKILRYVQSGGIV
jgi:hypothetical protein